MKNFRWELPCVPSDFCHFRKRIGEKGVEKIFQASIEIHGKAALESEIIVAATVQEKNITFPTDTKLRVKVMERYQETAKEENIKLRRSYRRELKIHQRAIRFNRTCNTKVKNRAMRRIKTIANALTGDVTLKLSPEKQRELAGQLELFTRAVNQKRNDKNKIYSLFFCASFLPVFYFQKFGV